MRSAWLWQRRYWPLVAVLLSALFASAPARAEPLASKGSEPFRLVYSSSAGCGAGAGFLSELEQRTARLRPARAGEHAITLVVELFGAQNSVRGELTVRKPDGDLITREVPGPNCEEVESALALIVALMVDPLAGNPERRVVPGRSGSDLGAPAMPVAKAARVWSYRIEQRATLRSAIAPPFAWGQSLGLMLTREVGALRPSLGVSGALARATASQAQGSAEFEWAAAQLSVCPIGFSPTRAWDLRACGVFQAGRLRAAGFATLQPAAKSIFWGAAGVELEARVALVGPLWFGLDSALELPFSRERFYFDPGQTLHRVPALGASFGAGLGLRFF